jgi:hypothetical protein
MKYLLSLFLWFTLSAALAQLPQARARTIKLPPELADHKNQFSGLFIQDQKLFFMSESRLQDKDRPEGKIYAIALTDLSRQLTDSAYALPYRKYHLQNLEILKDRIVASGQAYEGLEAMIMDGQQLYFSVETATSSSNCYLLKGRLTDTSVVMDTTFLLALPKPTAPDGKHIYNAGFEAMALGKNGLTAFFEYNYFPTNNNAYRLPAKGRAAGSMPKPVPIQRLPFRITDITAVGNRHFTAINYFYQGGGDDSVYRTANADQSTRLIKPAGKYRSYCRLIDLKITNRKCTWKPLVEFPAEFMNYNWEGIAAYKQGYFIMNDTYTPQKPYASVLLYVEQPR